MQTVTRSTTSELYLSGIKLLTVRSIFFKLDFDLFQSQPSVLVHAEVVKDFSHRFSVRIFHLGGPGLDHQIERHVVVLHLL